MKRYAFLARLEELLAALPEQEREDALTYYEEYLDAAGREQEAAAIAALGTPEEVAGKILEGEGLAAPTPAPPAPPAAPQPPRPGEPTPLPAPPAPRPGQPAPPPAPRPEPPAPGAQPPAPKPGAPTPPPAPPAAPQPPKPGEPTPPPAPHPGEPTPPPPPAGGRPVPPRPGAEPPHPTTHGAPAPRGGQAWKIVAIVAAAVVALAVVAMAFEYAEERAEHRQEPSISAPVQQGSAFSQPAQSTAAQPQTPAQTPAPAPAQSAASDTAQNTDGTQTIGNDTTYAVNSADGTATVATAAAELELTVLYGDVLLVQDDTVTQPTVEITGAEQGTFDVKREKNELKLVDLRRGTGDTTPVTVTVHAPAALREADIEVGAGSITLQGTLPPETSVHVGSGDITAESVSVQELDAETGTGGIALGRVEPRGRAVSLDFVSGNGDIAVTVVGAESDYQQELETGTGSITVNGEARARGEYNRQAANELEAKCGSGSITLAFIAQ